MLQILVSGYGRYVSYNFGMSVTDVTYVTSVTPVDIGYICCTFVSTCNALATLTFGDKATCMTIQGKNITITSQSYRWRRRINLCSDVVAPAEKVSALQPRPMFGGSSELAAAHKNSSTADWVILTTQTTDRCVSYVAHPCCGAASCIRRCLRLRSDRHWLALMYMGCRRQYIGCSSPDSDVQVCLTESQHGYRRVANLRCGHLK